VRVLSRFAVYDSSFDPVKNPDVVKHTGRKASGGVSGLFKTHAMTAIGWREDCEDGEDNTRPRNLCIFVQNSWPNKQLFIVDTEFLSSRSAVLTWILKNIDSYPDDISATFRPQTMLTIGFGSDVNVHSN
jgi:hypothetical protein